MARRPPTDNDRTCYRVAVRSGETILGMEYVLSGPGIEPRPFVNDRLAEEMRQLCEAALEEGRKQGRGGRR